MEKKPHKHAAVIKAWADGAEIQCNDPSFYNPTWTDIDHPHWELGMEYRVKPGNVHRYLPVYKVDNDAKVVAGLVQTTKDAVLRCDPRAHKVLHIEINPDTLELVKATMEDV